MDFDEIIEIWWILVEIVRGDFCLMAGSFGSAEKCGGQKSEPQGREVESRLTRSGGNEVLLAISYRWRTTLDTTSIGRRKLRSSESEIYLSAIVPYPRYMVEARACSMIIEIRATRIETILKTNHHPLTHSNEAKARQQKEGKKAPITHLVNVSDSSRQFCKGKGGRVPAGSDADHPIPIPATTTTSTNPTPNSTIHFTTKANHHAHALKVLTSNSPPSHQDPFPSADARNEKEHASADTAPFGFDSNVDKKQGGRKSGGAGVGGEGEEKKVVANGIGDPEKQHLQQQHLRHDKEKRLLAPTPPLRDNNVPSSASDESTAVDALTITANEGEGDPSNRPDDNSTEINDGRPLLLGKRLAVLIAYVFYSHSLYHAPFIAVAIVSL
ncbi:10831_t:CDS:2, partial [Acaulospora colombiana]